MEFQTSGSRRQFLSTVAMTAGAAMLLRPRLGWAADMTDPRVDDIVAKTIGIDTHNHIDVPLTDAEMPGPDIDLAGEMKRSGLSAICMTFATDYQQGDAYDRFLKGLASMDRQLKRNGMKRSLTPADVRAAHENGQPTVIQAVEGGHFLQGNLERVEEAYETGFAALWAASRQRRLRAAGRRLHQPSALWRIDRIRGSRHQGMQSAGHADRSCACQCADHGSRAQGHDPAGLISHTGLDTQLGSNPSMAGMMRPRLIGKEQAKAVADAGGAVGVWTHLADTPLEYAKNIRALVDVIGVDHVCIGTDTKLTQPSPRPVAALARWSWPWRASWPGGRRGQQQWPRRGTHQSGMAGSDGRVLLRGCRCDVKNWLHPG